MTAIKRLVVVMMGIADGIVLTETVNGDGTLSVVLDDLVRSGLSTSSLDHGVAVTLNGKGILADIDPPNVLDGASSLTVDTLDLVLANDGVLEGTAVLDNENGVGVTALSLACARHTTAVGLHATIESSADLGGCLEGNRALGCRDGESGALGKGEDLVGSGGSRASGGEASDGSNDGKRELHCDGWLVLLGRSKVERVFVGESMYKKVSYWKSSECGMLQAN